MFQHRFSRIISLFPTSVHSSGLVVWHTFFLNASQRIV
nr:MAG TPA: hypothetical protein [Caudoviricetes sp.]